MSIISRTNSSFYMGTFLAVQGVSELHLCGRRGKNIHFWMIHSLRTAKEEMKELSNFLKKFLDFELLESYDLNRQSSIHLKLYTGHFKA